MLLLLTAVAATAQAAHKPEGVPVRVTDLRGSAFRGAHVYTREVLPQPDPMHYVGETDQDGRLLLPPDLFARDVLVFVYSFLPWTGSVRGGSSAPLAVHMRPAPCGSVDGDGCNQDWDVFGPPKRKRR